IVTTEDVLMESNSIRMSGVGSINIPQETMDYTAGMHPFVTIDKIVSMIPLAGWIIEGREKSTITMYYSVKGALTDPQVSPLPVESVGKKVLGIFERVLTAPIKVLEPPKKE
ncbi:MAG: AsmA-like C-terminal domain-containing protein, partial [Deltaproteobacteria bacterium]|nr:AsmA-like C-terminal domain-containing protein [Deltaproteobacteria bacterium]